VCVYHTHVHTHIGGGFPGSQRKRRWVVGHQKWSGARLGRRHCPQTRESSPLGAVTMVPPVDWSLVDNKRNTHTGKLYFTSSPSWVASNGKRSKRFLSSNGAKTEQTVRGGAFFLGDTKWTEAHLVLYCVLIARTQGPDLEYTAT
jgi:hypothetical protein